MMVRSHGGDGDGGGGGTLQRLAFISEIKLAMLVFLMLALCLLTVAIDGGSAMGPIVML